MKRSFIDLDDIESDSSLDNDEINKKHKPINLADDEVSLVKHVSVNERNKHPNDDKITFEPIEHKYMNELKEVYRSSVTGIIKIAAYEFPEEMVLSNIFRRVPETGFEQEPWNRRVVKRDSAYYNMTRRMVLEDWKYRNLLGSYIHDAIDQFYSSPEYHLTRNSSIHDAEMFFYKVVDFKRKELSPFVQAFLLSDNYLRRNGWEIYRTEWRIASPEHNLAGSIDAVFKRINKKREVEYLIVDWKCNEASFVEVKSPKTLQEPWETVPNSKLGVFGGQLNLYAYMLRKYGIHASYLQLHQLTKIGQRTIHDVKLNPNLPIRILRAWDEFNALITVLDDPALAEQLLQTPHVIRFKYHANNGKDD
jgi:hypothetical protein